jgi:hypothetical protein
MDLISHQAFGGATLSLRTTISSTTAITASPI